MVFEIYVNRFTHREEHMQRKTIWIFFSITFLIIVYSGLNPSRSMYATSLERQPQLVSGTGDWSMILFPGFGTEAISCYGVSVAGVFEVEFGVGASFVFDPGVSWLGATDGDNATEFFATTDNGYLYRINPSGRTVTEVGYYGGPVIKELAFREDSGVLYGTDDSMLYTVNRNSGTAIVIGLMKAGGLFRAMDYHAGDRK